MTYTFEILKKFLYPLTVTIVIFRIYLNTFHIKYQKYKRMQADINNKYLFLLYNKQYVYIEFGVGRTV